MSEEFTNLIKVKWIPFRKCEECNKRKFTTTLYHVHDTGLISYVKYNVCNRCMKEAKERVSKIE